jgi:O-antigen ligase
MPYDNSIAGRWIPNTLIAAVVLSVVSIFVSDTLFALAIGLWLWDSWRIRRLRWETPPFAWFVLFFLGAVVLSILLSPEVQASTLYLKKSIRFLYIILIYTYLDSDHLRRAFHALFLVLTASAAYGILQYFWLMDVHLLNRISGFMGHWMTFSGQLMLGLVALSGYVALGGKRLHPSRSAPETADEEGGWRYRAVLLVFLGILVLALWLTMTRSSWLGALAGLSVLFVLRIRKVSWLVVGLAALLGLFLLSPSHFKERLYSGFDLLDETTRVRIELVKTGLNMIKDHPLTGVGPRMVRRVNRDYRVSEEFPDWAYQHLHNSPLQIAAEMGLPALMAWLALWLKIGVDLVRFSRDEHGGRFSRCLGTIGAGTLVAFLAAGLFEYNFGDAEILILVLFLLTAPYAARIHGRRPV